MLKKFLTRLFSFLLVTGGLFYLTCEGIMRYPTAFEKLGYSEKWFKVYRIASKSKEKMASDTLFIGDSVGAQFFPYTSRQNYMPINGAILMPGHYIIAANTIASNPDLKIIIFVCSPASFGMTFENMLTCNNFVKPFYYKENFKYISESLHEKIEVTPYAWFYRFSIVKFLPFPDLNYTNGAYDPTILSPMTIEYVKKLADLCQSNGIALRIISPPLEKSLKENSNDFETLHKQIKEEGLTEIFKGYLASIEYLEPNQFIEGIHIKNELVANYRQNLLAYLKKNN